MLARTLVDGPRIGSVVRKGGGGQTYCVDEPDGSNARVRALWYSSDGLVAAKQARWLSVGGTDWEEIVNKVLAAWSVGAPAD